MAEFEQKPVSAPTRGGSLFLGIKSAKVNLDIIKSYHGKPLLVNPIPRNASKARDVTAAIFAVVLVLRTSCGAQIAPPIIKAIAVYMINLYWRPFACHPKICKSMGEILVVINANLQVAIIFDARWFPNEFCIEVWTPRWSVFPSENATCWLIIQNAAKIICGYVTAWIKRVIPDNVLRSQSALLRRWWSGLASSVRSAPLARLFYMRGFAGASA